MFASMRFSKESKHKMAQTNGGTRALLEVFSGHRQTRYNKHPLNQHDQTAYDLDMEYLITGWNRHALDKLSSTRLHFGLQHTGGWDAAKISERYPNDAYLSLVEMNSRYDSE